jgi:Protein of Unknown function (DUF2784)
VATVVPVLYRLLADATVVVHFAFILFVAVGGLMAWRWPRLLWLHVPAVIWGLAIVTVGYTCPLTPLEKYFERRGGAEAYEGGFVDRYIEDAVYPDEFTPHARVVAAALIAVGWAGVLWRARHGPGRAPVLGRGEERG